MKRRVCLICLLGLLLCLMCSMAEAFWYGPYDTYIDVRKNSSKRVYFRPHDPAQVGGSSWLAIPLNSPLLSLLSDAWQQGRKVRVWMGPPFINEMDAQKAATVKKAQIIWDEKKD